MMYLILKLTRKNEAMQIRGKYLDEIEAVFSNLTIPLRF